MVSLHSVSTCAIICVSSARSAYVMPEIVIVPVMVVPETACVVVVPIESAAVVVVVASLVHKEAKARRSKAEWDTIAPGAGGDEMCLRTAGVPAAACGGVGEEQTYANSLS